MCRFDRELKGLTMTECLLFRSDSYSRLPSVTLWGSRVRLSGTNRDFPADFCPGPEYTASFRPDPSPRISDGIAGMSQDFYLDLVFISHVKLINRVIRFFRRSEN